MKKINEAHYLIGGVEEKSCVDKGCYGVLNAVKRIINESSGNEKKNPRYVFGSLVEATKKFARHYGITLDEALKIGEDTNEAL